MSGEGSLMSGRGGLSRRTVLSGVAAGALLVPVGVGSAAASGGRSVVSSGGRVPASVGGGSAGSGSVFEVMPVDETAVVLGSEDFPVHGDGVGDDTASLQAAIDEASLRGSENGWGNIVAPARDFGTGDGGGVVFVPEGTYRISATLDLHDSVRLIGFGVERPTIFLGPETEGFQEGTESYLLIARRRPYQPDGPAPTNGYNDTFGTGLLNVNLQIGPGNPAAVGIRFAGAQMFLLQDVDIDVGEGYAGIDHNVHMMQRVTIHGGEIGLLSYADVWTKAILDCTFEGQRQAAIRTLNDAKLTILRTRFVGVSTGIEAGWAGQWQHLYVQDSVFEDVSGAAFRLNDSESIPGLDEPELVRAQNQLNVINTGVASVGALLRLTPSGRSWAGPGSSYLVDEATVGLRVQDALTDGESRSDEVVVAARPAGRAGFDRLLVSDIPLPPATDRWVNIVEYAAEHGVSVGAGGDDLAIFQQAIGEHETIYVPLGQYVFSDTLELAARTNLIALHPRQTWLMLPEEAEGFTDPQSPRALVHTPAGGSNIVMGLGLDTGKVNAGSVQIRWQSGRNSHLSDIVTPFVKYFPVETLPGEPGLGSGDPGYGYRGANKYSIWVDGGGGTFASIWSMTGWAENGFLIENTTIPSRIYKVSIEHHQYNEIVVHNVENWEFYAIQTEDHIYGGASVAVEMVDAQNLYYGHTDFFRVATVKEPNPHAMTVENSSGVTIRGVRGYRPPDLPLARWGATITDVDSGRSVPDLEASYIGAGVEGGDPRQAGTFVALDSPRVGGLAGGTVQATLILTNYGPDSIRDLAAQVEVPDGWRGAVSVDATRLRPGKSARATIEAVIPSDAEDFTSMDVAVTISHRRGGDSVVSTQRLTVNVGGENLALSASVEASSVLGANVAGNAINGAIDGGRWISGRDDPAPRLTLDLGAPADVRSLRVFSGLGSFERFTVRAMRVSVLVDGQWSEVAALEGNTASPAEVDLTGAPRGIQQVRLDFTEPSQVDDIARIYEVQIFGMPSQEGE